MTRSLTVLTAGVPVLVQDLGRPGWANVGVSRSGAADRSSFALGGRLLGNDPNDAALEITFGNAQFRAETALTIALTGAPAPTTVDGSPVPHTAPVFVPAGSVIALGAPASGLRSYLSVCGGVAVEPVLGSCASDTLSGIGPEPLVAGSTVPIGPVGDRRPPLDLAPVRPPESECLWLNVIAGPRADWLAQPSALIETRWRVSSDSNRVGMRLEGEPLQRAEAFRDAELPSEGVVRGAIQVPGGGQPVIFLADHPVTGGYPVVGVLTERDADRAAQARPGQEVRFRFWVGEAKR